MGVSVRFHKNITSPLNAKKPAMASMAIKADILNKAFFMTVICHKCTGACNSAEDIIGNDTEMAG